jgi:hypothetical protein
MFLEKFDILINKQATPITNFNDEVTKLPALTVVVWGFRPFV